MNNRWFVLSIAKDDVKAHVVGNCETQDEAINCIEGLGRMGNDVSSFKIVGPITLSMIQGIMTEADLDAIEGEISQVEYKMAGGVVH